MKDSLQHLAELYKDRRRLEFVIQFGMFKTIGTHSDWGYLPIKSREQIDKAMKANPTPNKARKI